MGKIVHMQREIDRIKKQILILGGIVEESLQKSVKALRERDAELARSIVDYDSEIDRMEVELEEDCLKILALHQPVAIDLRFIISVFKINNDLERIADLAANMASRALYLCGKQTIEIPDFLDTVVQTSQSMLKRSLDALVNMDPELARTVIRDDDIIDNLHRRMYDYVQNRIQSNPEEVDCQINLLSVSRQLERVADSVTNIAEDVIYMVEGDIVRHRAK